MLPMSAW